MDTLKKMELKGKIEKAIKESLTDEEVLSMQELENIEGGEECAMNWCAEGCVPGCAPGCWWNGRDKSY